MHICNYTYIRMPHFVYSFIHWWTLLAIVNMMQIHVQVPAMSRFRQGWDERTVSGRFEHWGQTCLLHGCTQPSHGAGPLCPSLEIISPPPMHRELSPTHWWTLPSGQQHPSGFPFLSGGLEPHNLVALWNTFSSQALCLPASSTEDLDAWLKPM